MLHEMTQQNTFKSNIPITYIPLQNILSSEYGPEQSLRLWSFKPIMDIIGSHYRFFPISMGYFIKHKPLISKGSDMFPKWVELSHNKIKASLNKAPHQQPHGEVL